MLSSSQGDYTVLCPWSTDNLSHTVKMDIFCWMNSFSGAGTHILFNPWVTDNLLKMSSFNTCGTESTY